MTLEEEALGYLRGLADAWDALFRQLAGLDLHSARLAEELLAERRIDCSLPGFADFDPASHSAVVPGDPASCLIYHALAPPQVKPAGAAAEDYPTPAELDLIENWILSLAPLDLSAIPEHAVIAVMAYEYRPGPFTTHRRGADFVYSPTGIARVGEVAAVRDRANRCWLGIEPGSGRFAVMPARYAAFLAVPRRRTPRRHLGAGSAAGRRRRAAVPAADPQAFPGCGLHCGCRARPPLRGVPPPREAPPHLHRERSQAAAGRAAAAIAEGAPAAPTAARYHDALVREWEGAAATLAHHYRRLGIAPWAAREVLAAS